MGAYQDEGWTEILETKWAWHQENDVPGGVCDMTLLHFFRQGRKAVNLSMVRDGSVWDDNINRAENYLEDEYAMWPEGIKKSSRHESWTDNRPALLRIATFIELVFANALHFQGQAKRLMEEYRG